jgi:hypothetical protein
VECCSRQRVGREVKSSGVDEIFPRNDGAIHYIKTDKEGTKVIYSKNLKLTDPEGLERAHQAYVSVFPKNLLPTADGVKTMLDDLALRNPKAATADPKAFVDMSLVQEIEATGFIKQLYWQ